MARSLKVASLFSGAGGLDRGIHLVRSKGTDTPARLNAALLRQDRADQVALAPRRPATTSSCSASLMRAPGRWWPGAKRKQEPCLPPHHPHAMRLPYSPPTQLSPTNQCLPSYTQVLRAAFPGTRIHEDVCSLERLPQVCWVPCARHQARPPAAAQERATPQGPRTLVQLARCRPSQRVERKCSERSAPRRVKPHPPRPLPFHSAPSW